MYNKIGFWSVLALVVSSQVGSGIFMLPLVLAQYGSVCLLGWIIAALGGISIALVFSKLCYWLPQTGGPHVYVKKAFGPVMALFTGWTYWLISFISSVMLVKLAVGYFTALTSQIVYTNSQILLMEIGLLIVIVLINLRGVKTSGRIEFILTALKFLTLFIIPVLALYFFKYSNVVATAAIVNKSFMYDLNHVILIAMWGFIGVELATTPASSVKDAVKTIPKAIILGTLLVAMLYIINIVTVMGSMSVVKLIDSKAPYSDFVHIVFGGNWHMLMSVLAMIFCIGTLNAWTLSSGQVALGIAKDGLLPKIFASVNKGDAPQFNILVSSVVMFFMLYLTYDPNFLKQINMIIDMSVLIFISVYIICIFSMFKIGYSSQYKKDFGLMYKIAGVISFVFCLWILINSEMQMIIVTIAFILSGIPLYLWYISKNHIFNIKKHSK